jgi:NACHT domain
VIVISCPQILGYHEVWAGCRVSLDPRRITYGTALGSAAMAGKRTPQKQLLASAVLLGVGALLILLAFFLHAKGAQQATALSGVIGLFVSIAALLSPLIGRMMTWLKDSPAGLSDVSLSREAESLAEALAVQWAQQEGIRKVNNPWPLPVRWRVTDQARAAMLDVSWRDVGRPGHLVAPSALHGSFDEIQELFVSRLPYHRLVVLGESGSGKSMLAIRLALKLMSDRKSGDPVPVLVSLATWKAGQVTLVDFATSQLIRDQPALGTVVRVGEGQSTSIALALLTTGKLLLILDGMDEIPSGLRAEALRGISDLPSDSPVLVTSRTTEYVRAVVDRGSGLARAAVVELLPLSLAEVRTYLKDATAPPASRWKPVFDHLSRQKNGQLANALQTPLMIWLTRTIYADTDTMPSTLVSMALEGGSAAIEKHLMSSLIPAVFTPGEYSASMTIRWKPGRAEAWLRFVAQHLQEERTPDFAWWDLNRRVPRIVHGIVGGVPIGVPIALVVGIVVGIAKGTSAGLVDGLAAGIGVGLIAGLPGGLVSWRKMIPSRVEFNIRGHFRQVIRRLWVGLLFGFGLGALVGLPVAFIYGPVYGVIVILALGSAIGLALSFRRLFDASSDVSAASPASTLHDDTMSAILQASMACIGLGVGAGIALYVTIRFGVVTGVSIGATYGLAYGISIGLGVRWSRVTTPAFMPFLIARTWLAAQRKLPWSLMPFLEDAHRLGVLRQQGAVYQFRHAALQEHLAANETMHQMAARRAYEPRSTKPLGQRRTGGL